MTVNDPGVESRRLLDLAQGWAEQADERDEDATMPYLAAAQTHALLAIESQLRRIADVLGADPAPPPA